MEDPKVLGEIGGQPTSVDLCFFSTVGERVFVEFKFTEAEFGGCSVFRDGDCDGGNPAGDFDQCYLHRIGRRYWSLMEKHGLLRGCIVADSQCAFTNLYQAYRLVLYTLEEDGHFLLLYDERNPAFLAMDRRGRRRGLYARVLESLPDRVRSRCHALSIQEFLNVVEPQGLEWVQELRDKHFLAVARSS